MPLPKLPTKPAALLSAQDYQKVEPGKSVKPRIAIVEPVARSARAKTPAAAPQARDKPAENRPVESRKIGKAPIDKPRAVIDKTVKPTDRPKSSISRAAD